MKIESETDYENAVARLEEIPKYSSIGGDDHAEYWQLQAAIYEYRKSVFPKRKRPDNIDRFVESLDDDKNPNQAGGVER